MFASLLTLALAASSVFALPSALPRQTTSLCDPDGPTFGNGGPYTIAAINKTDIGSDVPGIRLVFGPPIATDNKNRRSLSTIDTYSKVEFPTVKLEDGALVGLNADGTIGAVDLDVDAGNPTVWAPTNTGAAKVYCGLVGTSPHGGNPVHPLLALHDDADSFSLCTASSEFFPEPLDVLVYKAEDNGLYDFASCREVAVQLVDA
ncbi:hypothetical protein L227DRAFT_86344 [Lentinus tigrinus ALCF2SS1-6]|uniref:Uncharacterized protein n=1 Tax=Lentinus tigrinus ALCF2SS1-6 TaxID=1328759 RepID=A0A5C2SC92_9APHY|nr:hypothetical protein L227DRAFT_86344 [Lentinus tigrinus ALCF2SS1-6]